MVHLPKECAALVRFGRGSLIVSTGTFANEPAVFVEPTMIPGPVGAAVPEAQRTPLQALSDGAYVMTFPTHEQARAVADALVTPIAGKAA